MLVCPVCADEAMVEIVTEPTESPSLFFVGDVAKIDDSWDSLPLDPAVQSFIDEADFALANLEGSLPTGDAISKQGPNLEIDRTTLTRLDQMGFDGVSLANNHVMDFGVEGMRSTLDACQEVGLDTVGAGEDSRDAIDPIRCEIDGTSVGVFAVSEHEELNATNSTPGTCWVRTAGISATIQQKTSEFDVTIVVAHGGIEYIPIPPPSWRRLLRGFAELDIDAVIGHHPHCPQGWEIYEDTPICFSLGNFMMVSSNRPATHRSIGVGLSIGETGPPSFSVTPFEISNKQVTYISKEHATQFVDYLNQLNKVLENHQDSQHYWQSVVNALFERKYEYKFSEYGRGGLSSLISHPLLTLDRLTRGCTGDCVEIERSQAILDTISNESHRAVVRSMLNDRLSNHHQELSASDNELLEQYYRYYDGKEIPPWRVRQLNRFKTLLTRLSR